MRNARSPAPARPSAVLLLIGLAAAALAYPPAVLVFPPADRLRPPVQLAFYGDVMLGRGVAAARQAAAGPGAAPDWSAVFQALRGPTAAAALAVANLESPVTGLPPLDPAAYDLRAAPGSLRALTAAGFDAVTVANNHAADSGPAGQHDTLRAAAAAGLLPVAAGQVRFFRAGPYRVGLLALDDVSAPLDLPASTAALARARPWVDLLAITVHWGQEYAPGPSPREQDLARAWARAGADLVVGHHPHVLQPVEFLSPAAPSGRPALVAYSLGNALFDQPAPPEARWGAVLFVEWTAAGLGQVSLLPFEINIRTGAVEPAGADEIDWVQNRVNSPRVILRADYR